MGIEEILNLHTHWVIDTAPIISTGDGVERNATLFITNDKRLENFPDLNILVLDDFLSPTTTP